MNNNLVTQWYRPLDIIVKGVCSKDNPFLAELKGEFTGPEGETIVIPGFYDGDNTWRIRFSPTRVGVWKYDILSDDIAYGKMNGEIQCIENENKKVHGRLGVNPDYPHHFKYEDGISHFMLAYECDWLWALDLGKHQGSETQEFIDSIKEYGFNNIVMNVYAHDTTWAKGRTCDKDYGPPALYAWKGSNDYPDQSRFNSQFFSNYDRVVTILLNEGITAHILLKVYNKAVKWPEKYSIEDDLYFKYIVARYQAFPNIIWDYSKEAYYEADKDYINSRIEIIKEYDAYKHLITLHDDRVLLDNCNYNKNLDFLTAQQHNDFYYSILYERQKRKWPVFNSEFGYEWGPLQKPLTWAAQNAEEFVGRAYEVVMAGGYPGYYYDYTAWDIIDFSVIPKGYSYFKILYDFFTSIEWWKLEPHPEVCCWHGRCLADIGREYVFYIDAYKNALFNMSFLDKPYTAQWINTYTGERVAGELCPHISSSDLRTSQCPFKDAPGILHIYIG